MSYPILNDWSRKIPFLWNIQVSSLHDSHLYLDLPGGLSLDFSYAIFYHSYSIMWKHILCVPQQPLQ
jgi:hypothetical protein